MKLLNSNATHVSAEPSTKLVWKATIMRISAKSSINELGLLQIIMLRHSFLHTQQTAPTITYKIMKQISKQARAGN